MQAIFTGVKNQVSNNSGTEFYQTVLESIRSYLNTVLSGVGVNHSKIAPSPKMLLNKNNIITTQFELLESYHQGDDEENPDKLLQSPFGKYYLLLHDNIQKFNKKLNGVLNRSLSSAWSPVNIPWWLTDIEGVSLDAT